MSLVLVSLFATAYAAPFQVPDAHPMMTVGDHIVAPMPDRDAAAELSKHGIRIGSATLRTTAVGREGAMSTVAAVAPQEGACVADPCVRRAEYVHDGLTEWWVDLGDRMEQGFDLTARPPGKGALRIELTIDGGRVEPAEHGAVLVHDGGETPVRDLFAFDAAQREIPVVLQAEGDRLLLVVDDADATYPIVVDPTYHWHDRLELQSSAFGFGFAMASGDLNCDGYDDLAVSAPTMGLGEVHVFYGSATGLSDVVGDVLTGIGPRYGSALAIGQLDGLQCDELLVGSPLYLNGFVDVYLGRTTGPVHFRTWTGSGSGEEFGSAIAIGDVNGDGLNDAVVGAPEHDVLASDNYGAIYFFPGFIGTVFPVSADVSDLFNRSGDKTGSSVAIVGDLDGDGNNDIVAGAPRADRNNKNNNGCVKFYSVSGNNLVHEGERCGSRSHRYMGYSVANIGDFDGDGDDDIGVGSPATDTFGSGDLGLVSVFLNEGNFSDTISSGVGWGDGRDGDAAGWSLAALGDQDGDGYDDFVAGAPGDDRLVVVSGQDAFGLGALDYDNADGTAPGLVLATLDVDNDGRLDLAVSDVASRTVRILHPGANDRDDDTVQSSDDCDDNNAAVWEEFHLWPDADGDGYGENGADEWVCTNGVVPADRVQNGGDCDDDDHAISPDAAEVCDDANVDEDCDGSADDADPSASGLSPWYADEDGDQYGDASTSVYVCDPPEGYLSDASDCDDTTSLRNPGNTEVCDGDGLDEDCDGLVNDADPSVSGQSTWYADGDDDQYGDASRVLFSCEQPTGHVEDATDCDDTDSNRNPGNTEVCDDSDLDEDCNQLADDNDPSVTGQRVWYADVDADQYGDAQVVLSSCDQPTGYVADATDCDDSSELRSPGNTEVCDDADLDEDCNELSDDEDPAALGQTTWYADADGDLYGNVDLVVSACEPPAGYVADATDCDDTTGRRNPGQSEVCDDQDLDEDCDELVDDEDPSVQGRGTWYADDDGDGGGDANTRVVVCDQPAGHVADSTDCDDDDPAIYWNAVEVCNGIDDDCRSGIDNDLPDADLDGACDEIDPCPSSNPDDADDNGICDMDFQLELLDGSLTPGGTLQLDVYNAPPFATVYFGLSTTGAGSGPCPQADDGTPVCIEIDSPIVLGRADADADGTAWLDVTVPLNAPVGLTTTLQAAHLEGSGDVTPLVVTTVSP